MNSSRLHELTVDLSNVREEIRDVKDDIRYLRRDVKDDTWDLRRDMKSLSDSVPDKVKVCIPLLFPAYLCELEYQYANTWYITGNRDSRKGQDSYVVFSPYRVRCGRLPWL
jgi:radical SAM superfamily enzyme YgiQ (UPF0313 family)